MICPNCGQENRVGAKFCDECGIVLPTSVAARPANVPPRATYAPQPQRPVARRVESEEPGEETEADEQPSGTTMLGGMLKSDSEGARRTFAILAGLLVLALCFCCGAAAVALYVFYQSQP